MTDIVVIGVEPPCPKCRKTLENVKKAVREAGLEARVEVTKLDMNAPEVIKKYGLVISPSLAVKGKLVIAGRVPSKDEVAKILEKEFSQ